MPDYNYLKNFLYSYLENFDFKYYQCNYASSKTGLSTSITQENIDNKEVYLCVFLKNEDDCTNCNANNLTFNTSQWIVSFLNGDIKDIKQLKTIYFWNNTTVLNSSTGYANLYFNRKYNNFGRYPDILKDSNFYEIKKLDDLKVSLGSSGNNSNVSLDMTNTNNILFSILLAICVLICYLVFRKLFYRGV